MAKIVCLKIFNRITDDVYSIPGTGRALYVRQESRFVYFSHIIHVNKRKSYTAH
jgi:hypothetical protein